MTARDPRTDPRPKGARMDALFALMEWPGWARLMDIGGKDGSRHSADLTWLVKHGYAKARRIGMVAMVGGKDKKVIRDRTTPEFRDVLLSIAKST